VPIIAEMRARGESTSQRYENTSARRVTGRGRRRHQNEEATKQGQVLEKGCNAGASGPTARQMEKKRPLGWLKVEEYLTF